MASSVPPSVDDARAAADVLERLLADPEVFARLPIETRQRLLEAAGRFSRPDVTMRVRLKKLRRRMDRADRRVKDAILVDRTELRIARRAPIYLPPPPRTAECETDGADGADRADRADRAQSTLGELADARSCYVCKVPYRRVHFFYDSLCPDCGELNHRKRTQSVPLHGRVAMVTGGRIKIGYQTALLLLRAGAQVIVTTRFPNDSALRFSREPDFADWQDRLQLHGLDLRHSPSVELFARWLAASMPRLDLLINNAAQTVARPTAFYAHLIAAEARLPAELPEAVRPLLAAHTELRKATGLATAGAWQLKGAFEESLQFPEGEFDADLQQIDRREVNSWRLEAGEVPTAELLEVHLVNSVAPFLLTSRLKPLLRRAGGDSHIVNVSAMEAQFSRRKKTTRHPHTNMAKAALNMLTRTSAEDYAKDGIFMNSVDTGWVTDEDPMHHAVRKRVEHDFHPPLDSVDGAARVLDPPFVGLQTGVHPWGQFFKDYRPTGW